MTDVLSGRMFDLFKVSTPGQKISGNRMGADDVMIQAEIGGAARVDPGTGLQRPGYMIRDFILESSPGQNIQISSFRGRANLVLVFPGHSDAMRILLEDAARHSRELIELEATVVVIVPQEQQENTLDPSILVLHDSTHAVHRRYGATDEHGRPVPVVYVTDRFGEIASTYAAPGHMMPPKLEEILNTLEFLNQQCPECEPPEWPR